MDRSLLISWYDVAANHRDEYLQWLHGSFMQKLMKRDGVLWAAHYEVRKYDIPSRVRPTRDPAVARGNDFVLMLGAESSHVFAKPLDFFLKKDASCVEPDLTAEDRRMLALRKEVRTSVMTEEARVSGPSIAMRADGGAPAALIRPSCAGRRAVRGKSCCRSTLWSISFRSLPTIAARLVLLAVVWSL